MSQAAAILFTVFEPSGDALAARLIEELKARQPDRRIVALGGPKMEAAGAELIEETTEHAKMGLSAVSEARELLRRVGVVKAWLKENPIAALVPTDSPAANWSMCKAVRKLQPEARIVHLVGPQLWAWASWRIARMRRLSDHVMCLLPFEVQWFSSRGVEATFVGHPLFQEADREASADDSAHDGEPKLALLPGSRSKEIERNWPTMLALYEKLRHRYPGLAVGVAAAGREREKQILRLSPGGRLPRGMHMVVGDAGAVLDWADCGVVVSGTATLQAASRSTPSVVIYRVSRKAWQLGGRWLINSRTFALPNIIAESIEQPHAMPELVPFFGDVDQLHRALEPLLTEGPDRQAQREVFTAIREIYDGKVFRTLAADTLLEQIGER